MKRRTMRSLCAGLMMVCLLVTSLTVSAGAAVITPPEIVPQYTGISALEADLNINDDGCATCYGYVRVKSGYTVTLSVQLKRDGVVIKTWSDSGTSSFSIEEDYYVTGNHDYQVIVTAKVKNSAGTVIETPSVRSVIVSYSG